MRGINGNIQYVYTTDMLQDLGIPFDCRVYGKRLLNDLHNDMFQWKDAVFIELFVIISL